jgi:hypothetical protein
MIENVDNVEKVEKVVSISGLCTNCKNEKMCDFVEDAKIFIINKKCAKKILDTELTIYSCDEYEVEKDIYPESGMCLSCKQESYL